MIVDSTAEDAVLAASKLAETTVCSDKTKTAPFPLGLQQREGRCDHYGLDCSQYEYSCYDYDCKLSVAGQYNYDYNCCNCNRLSEAIEVKTAVSTIAMAEVAMSANRCYNNC